MNQNGTLEPAYILLFNRDHFDFFNMSSVKFTLATSKSTGVMSRAILILNKYKYTPISQKIINTPNSEHSELVIIAEGGTYNKKLSDELVDINGVVSILKIEKDQSKKKTISETVGNNHKSKKVQCKNLMIEIFGEKVAQCVDEMTEDNCVSLCHAKAIGLIGPEGAKLFDKIM